MVEPDECVQLGEEFLDRPFRWQLGLRQRRLGITLRRLGLGWRRGSEIG